MKFLKNTDAAIFAAKVKKTGFKNKTTPKKKAKFSETPSEEEIRLREELGLCYRTLYKAGIHEGCDTHLSLALEDQDAFLTLPYGIIWSTVKPEDFCLVDFDGDVLRKSARINQLTG
jgi:hypothetical protein